MSSSSVQWRGTPRRESRSPNRERVIPASSAALPNDRMPCAYSPIANSLRRRGSISDGGRRRLSATESGMFRVIPITLTILHISGSPPDFSVVSAGSVVIDGLRPYAVCFFRIGPAWSRIMRAILVQPPKALAFICTTILSAHSWRSGFS